MELNSNAIQEILPHRYPFLMVDRIDDYEPGKWAKGVKCVSANEMQFIGHFPQYHVLPGVLIIEALAQVGAIAVLAQDAFKGKIALLGGVKNVRFRRQVVPGDTLELECTIDKIRGPVGVGKGTAKVNGEIAVEGELTFFIQSA